MYATALLLATATLAGGGPQAPKTGDELIRQMYQRYAGKWYQTLTFVQKTTQPNGAVETWYEAARIPGYLRIDIAPLDSGRAILFRNDSIYQVRGGKVQQSGPLIHPLMVLGFDVYLDPPEKTIEKLKRLNFDLSRIHAGTWQGKSVWIVGANPGDEKTHQFWVEQENLLFVRMFRTNPQGVTGETQFNKYFKVGDGWIAPEVLFFNNGQTGVIEEYSDVKVGVALAPELFEPAKFGPPGWVK